MLQAVPRDSVLGVETPNSPDNFSAVTVEHAVDGTAVQLKVPGTWVLQIATPTFRQLVTLLGDVITIALLEDGWKPSSAGERFLQRKCAPAGRAAWIENMTLTVAPIGSFSPAMLCDLEHLFVMRFPFLQYDATKAHASGSETPPIHCPCACSSLEEVEKLVHASELANLPWQ